MEELDGAAWRRSSVLAAAQLVLNHSERSASAFHSQLTSGLHVCVSEVFGDPFLPPSPPSPHIQHVGV